MISRNPTSMPAPMLRDAMRPKNSLFRAAAVMLRAHVTGLSPELTAKHLYGKDHGLDPFITHTASTPATTSTPAWLGLIAHDVIYTQLIQKITGLSAAAGLMMQGLRVDLSGVASITIPGRLYNPASGGDWIAEGAAIPFRKPILSPGPKLTPHKLGVLATFSRELVEAGSNIEEFTTQAIRESTAALLDLQMFSTNPGDAVHPPGILIGANTVTATSVAAPWAISSDIGALVQALATNGGGLEPVIIAAPAQASSLRMWRQADFFPILASVALPAGTVVAVEASSFVSGQDGIPEFSTSTGATLHMEDTTPKDIVSSGGVVATPVKSMFQTDIIGLRMILRASWAMRNPLHVAVVHGVSW